jgi:CubicO group peptidase (beta-lactamase class C family)
MVDATSTYGDRNAPTDRPTEPASAARARATSSTAVRPLSFARRRATATPMHATHLALLFVTALGLSSCTPGRPAPAPQTQPAPDPTVAVLDADLADALAQRLADFAAARRIPGLAVAIGRDGSVVWSHEFGVSDLALGTPVTGETVFPLGSTSKPLTALLLGQLVDEGRLDLDAPVQAYVPYFPEKEHVVTPRLLAGHLAGLRDYDHAAGEYDNTRHFASVREAVGVFADDPLEFEPGTRHAYSAYNFVLLSAVLEGAAGADFETLLTRRLVEPLALRHTGFNRAPLPGLATSYTTGPFGRVFPARVGDPSNKWAAGGLVSTPREMVAIGNAALAGRIVEPATFALLTTPQTLSDGSDSGAGYGLGWRRGERVLADGRSVAVVHHGGTGPGSMSFFVLYPSEGLVLSLQSNLLFQPFDAFAAQAFALAESVLVASTPP